MPVDPLASASRAQRAFEHISLYQLANGSEGMNRWLAISLADGSCDQRGYSTKAEAIRFQLHETQCAYLFFNGVPTVAELRFFLDACEELYDQGLSLADPATYVNPEFML